MKEYATEPEAKVMRVCQGLMFTKHLLLCLALCLGVRPLTARAANDEPPAAMQRLPVAPNQPVAPSDAVGCRVQAVEADNRSGWFTTHHGSGVAIGRREVLTAAHVVGAPGARVKVEFGGRWIACSVAGVDAKTDLALLSAAEDLPNFAVLAADKESVLFMVASGETRPVNVSSGFVLKSRADFGDMAHGKSGGGVLNGSGQLVGLVIQGEPVREGSNQMRTDVTWFVGAVEIRKFLAWVSVKKF